ncbi:MAG TPA: thioredoxin domain-containing protein [Caulobacteraceae bacterium]|nr:thioredoxin domain-containing protein [Caulobacteraceae bacterium]
MRRIAAVSLSLLLALGACSGEKTSDPAFGAKVRTYLLEHPEVLEEALLKLEQNKAVQAREAAAKAIRQNLKGLERDPRDFALGPQNAKVVVVQFFDYRCPYCKTIAADYVRMANANPDVRFVFKEWPILDRGGEPVSEYAARAALAAKAQGRYLPVHQALMSAEALDMPTVDRILAANGVDLNRAKATLGSAEVSDQIGDIHKLAEQLNASGTPTFIVGGEVLEFRGPESLTQAIAKAKKG